MTVRRYVAICVVAFLVAEVLTGVIHGFLLASEYAPFYGTLLRSGTKPAWQFAFLPLAHLSFIVALVWIYARIVESGSWALQGLRLGILGWMLGQVPVWLLWYAEQPWPGILVLRQLGYELISSLIVGMTIAALGRAATRHRVRTSLV